MGTWWLLKGNIWIELSVHTPLALFSPSHCVPCACVRGCVCVCTHTRMFGGFMNKSSEWDLWAFSARVGQQLFVFSLWFFFLSYQEIAACLNHSTVIRYSSQIIDYFYRLRLVIEDLETFAHANLKEYAKICQERWVEGWEQTINSSTNDHLLLGDWASSFGLYTLTGIFLHSISVSCFTLCPLTCADRDNFWAFFFANLK